MSIINDLVDSKGMLKTRSMYVATGFGVFVASSKSGQVFTPQLKVMEVQAALTSYAVPLAGLVISHTIPPYVGHCVLSFLPNCDGNILRQVFQYLFWEPEEVREEESVVVVMRK